MCVCFALGEERTRPSLYKVNEVSGKTDEIVPLGLS